ncbi:hypothetical protein AB3Z07_09430 [Metabacillus halosaccharovorans]|uniref:hypothetical protein n=1 Tax=Metabacillus halosaccharovorans TaxID=930124 RepID=UPI0034CD31CD
MESFIVSNELEDKFISFLKIVAENEPVEEYRNAAKIQSDFYHFNIGGKEFDSIDNEYGWMVEEREAEQLMEECK